jgi:hypothetical protein
MKLQQLASTPQLIKIVLDEEEIVKQYGEPVEFHVYDRYDLDVYMKIATVDSSNFVDMAKTISSLILDEEGNPALKEGEVLPVDLVTRVIERVVNQLGNTLTQTSKE